LGRFRRTKTSVFPGLESFSFKSLLRKAKLTPNVEVSNVRDYARYLAAMMRQAGPVSKAGHALLKAPHNVVVPADGPWTGPVWYGAGWEAGVVRDEVVYFHGGQVNAFTANMLMVPGREFAIVTMLNAASLAQEVVVWKVLYDFLGVNEGERFDFEARCVPFPSLLGGNPGLCLVDEEESLTLDPGASSKKTPAMASLPPARASCTRPLRPRHSPLPYPSPTSPAPTSMQDTGL